MRERVAPFAGAWIEMLRKRIWRKWIEIVAPFAGAWIEIFGRSFHPHETQGRTLRGCVD